MTANSWLHLPSEDPRHALPAHLRSQDAMGGQDCGWVEQMLPFVQSHASPQGWVVDPFCGFGSTLVAASICGVPAAGVEVDPQRSEMARQRLDLLGAGHGSYPVLTGSIAQASTREQLVRSNAQAAARRFTLCLTNVPYFGCSVHSGPANEGATDQLYSHRYYAPYLQSLRDVFSGIHDLLEPEGWCVVMAQNLSLGGTFVPLAWDIARLLSDRFVLHEERLLIYDRASGASTLPTAASNRAHEYALVCRKQGSGMDPMQGRALLDQLARDGFEFAVYGSFARWLESDTCVAPGDMDLLFPPDEAQASRFLQCLEDRGFLVTSWNTPVKSPVSITALAHRHYFRARRLSHDGSTVQIDVTVVASRAMFDERLASRRKDIPELPYPILTDQ